MIALFQDLPLVQWKGDRNIPLSEGWIAESICRSANCLNVETADLADQVAKALVFHLKNEFRGTVISENHLVDLLKKSLAGIGYHDLAEKTYLTAPRVCIYLPEIAFKSGIPLLFFSDLKGRLNDAYASVICGIKLEGLRATVKHLEGAKKWKTGCNSLQSEIIGFTRQQILAWHAHHLELIIN